MEVTRGNNDQSEAACSVLFNITIGKMNGLKDTTFAEAVMITALASAGRHIVFASDEK